jgi:hypothetical protein
MRLFSTHSLRRLALASLVFVSCAAAAPSTDSGLPRPPEGPCELDAQSLRRIGQLDADFQNNRHVPETEPTGDGGYGYEFDDDPLGATVDALRAASLCLGGPGSERLWSHRNCLPHRATTATSNTTIDLAQNGCTVPDSAFVVVRVDGTTASASR